MTMKERSLARKTHFWSNIFLIIYTIILYFYQHRKDMYIKKPAKEMLLSNLDEESVGKTVDSIKRIKVHNECNAESRVKIKVKLDFN